MPSSLPHLFGAFHLSFFCITLLTRKQVNTEKHQFNATIICRLRMKVAGNQIAGRCDLT